MQLELAIATTCEPTGCQVRFLEDGKTSVVRYGNAMQDRIKIRPGDLVVVDSAARPPQVVWRWWHGRVERLEGGSAVVSRRVNVQRPGDPDRADATMPVPGWLAGSVTVGDTVYFSGHPGDILDIGRDGGPLHSDRVRDQGFPVVLARYAGMQDVP